MFPHIDLSDDDTGVTNTTIRGLLDRLVTLSPEYRWSEMNGVAVVRPVASWADPANALNLRVEPFHLDNTTVHQTLALILKLPPRNPIPDRVDNRAFSIAFNGGTMVEALNALVRAREGVGWNAGLLVHPTSSTFTVGIRTFNAGDRAEGEGAILMGTPLPRLLATR